MHLNNKLCKTQEIKNENDEKISSEAKPGALANVFEGVSVITVALFKLK